MAGKQQRTTRPPWDVSTAPYPNIRQLQLNNKELIRQMSAMRHEIKELQKAKKELAQYHSDSEADNRAHQAKIKELDAHAVASLEKVVELEKEKRHLLKELSTVKDKPADWDQIYQDESRKLQEAEETIDVFKVQVEGLVKSNSLMVEGMQKMSEEVCEMKEETAYKMDKMLDILQNLQSASATGGGGHQTATSTQTERNQRGACTLPYIGNLKPSWKN